MTGIEELESRLRDVENRLNVVDSMRRQCSVEIDETTRGKSVSTKIYFDPTNPKERDLIVHETIETMLMLGRQYNEERPKI